MPVEGIRIRGVAFNSQEWVSQEIEYSLFMMQEVPTVFCEQGMKVNFLIKGKGNQIKIIKA